MAILREQLSIQTGNQGSYSYSTTENYTEIFNKKQVVDSTNGFITIVETSSSIAANSLSGAKAIVIKNNGVVSSEIQLIVTDYKDNSDVDDANSVDLGPGSATTDRYLTLLLGAQEYVYLPNLKIVSYAEDASAANAKPTTSGAYLTLDTNEYVDSTADNDSATEDAMTDDTSATRVYLEPYTSAVNCTANLFHVGDLIRLDNEIMEVTAIGSKADLANNYIDVIRGAHGSTIAVHADDVAVRLPFFNANHDFDKFSVAQTDINGKFKAMNFFGFGRVADSTSDGIVPGSVAGKFYNAGYQSLGLSGISGSTNSGLAASTAYAFKITVDGGSAYAVSFTTDSSNVNFGGTNGIISKIQTVFNAAYYASGNLFEKRVMIGITQGDLRFTSGQGLSTSAILLAAPDSGATPFGVGRFPAIGNVNSAVAARLPDDTIIDVSGKTIPNINSFFYDDGHGAIKGTATGTINYTTGKIDFLGPASSEFTITANYDSAHSGGSNTTSTSANVVRAIAARSCNSKINCPIEIVAFN